MKTQLLLEVSRCFMWVKSLGKPYRVVWKWDGQLIWSLALWNLCCASRRSSICWWFLFVQQGDDKTVNCTEWCSWCLLLATVCNELIRQRLLFQGQWLRVISYWRETEDEFHVAVDAGINNAREQQIWDIWKETTETGSWLAAFPREPTYQMLLLQASRPV